VTKTISGRGRSFTALRPFENLGFLLPQTLALPQKQGVKDRSSSNPLFAQLFGPIPVG